MPSTWRHGSSSFYYQNQPDESKPDAAMGYQGQFSLKTTAHQQTMIPPPQQARQYASGTSSAFSASANPDEDWTQISDLAERRRIQNRIAQRNYRKKLKKRLEDLERRAGSPDDEAAPSTESEAKLPKTKTPPARTTARARQQQQHSNTLGRVRQQPQQHLEKPQQHAGLVSTYSPPLQAADVPVYPGMYAPASPSYPYAQTSPYPQEPAPAPLFAGASPYGSYPPLGSPQYMGGASSVTPPPMPSATLTPPMPPVSNFPEADGSFAAADSFASPYGYFGGIGIGIHNPYDGLNTPPLSNSLDCPDSIYDYPNTPLSMPESPEDHQSTDGSVQW